MKLYNIPLNCNQIDFLSDFLTSDINVNDIILLPTSRSCKLLKKELIKKSKKKALLLPHILSLDSASATLSYLFDNNTLKEINDFDLLFLFQNLISKMDENIKTSTSFALSSDLIALLKEGIKYDINWEKLNELDTSNFAVNWQNNSKFLKIITEFYPAYLKEENLYDRNFYKKELNEKLFEFLQNHTGKIILSGSTLNQKHVSNLILKLKDNDNFHLFLPGFNLDNLNQNIVSSHPDYWIKETLNKLKICKFENINYTKYEVSNTNRLNLSRLLFKSISEIKSKTMQKDAVENIKYFTSLDIDQEALIIGYEVYKAQKENKKTAVICPDVNLMYKIQNTLNKIGIPHDSSFPIDYNKSLFANNINIIFDFLNTNSLFSFLNLIKSKYFYISNTKDIELILRKENLNNISNDYKDLKDEHLEIKKQINEILKKLEPLKKELQKNQNNFSSIFDINLKVLTSLYPDIWKDELNQKGQKFLKKLLTVNQTINTCDYKVILNTLLSLEKITLNSNEELCTILGVIESRMINADVFIFCGLNEGMFPTFTHKTSFLNEELRSLLGFPNNEIKSLEGSDFQSIICKKEVILSRSEKVMGSPQIKSSYLQKLELILNYFNIKIQNIENQEEIIKHFIPKEFESIKTPFFNPPICSRPKELSATNLELLIKNPYEIYVKKILKLYKLNNYYDNLIYLSFGNTVHKTVEIFANNQTLTKKELIEFFKKEILNSKMPIASGQFFSSRADNIVDFILNENEVLPQKVLTESTFNWEIIPNFKVSAKIDKINIFSDNTYEIIDYKTGQLPKKKDIEQGKKVQVSLPALMIENQILTEFKDLHLSKIYYKKINGIKKEEISITYSEFEKFKDVLLTDLKNLLIKYNDPKTGYNCKKTDDKYSDYKYIQRLKEWN